MSRSEFFSVKLGPYNVIQFIYHFTKLLSCFIISYLLEGTMLGQISPTAKHAARASQCVPSVCLLTCELLRLLKSLLKWSSHQLDCRAGQMRWIAIKPLEWMWLTCVDTVVGLQLVLEAELLSAAVTFIRLLSGMDALVTLQRALVTEAAPTELALERVVTCHAEKQW